MYGATPSNRRSNHPDFANRTVEPGFAGDTEAQAVDLTENRRPRQRQDKTKRLTKRNGRRGENHQTAAATWRLETRKDVHGKVAEQQSTSGDPRQATQVPGERPRRTPSPEQEIYTLNIIILDREHCLRIKQPPTGGVRRRATCHAGGGGAGTPAALPESKQAGRHRQEEPRHGQMAERMGCSNQELNTTSIIVLAKNNTEDHHRGSNRGQADPRRRRSSVGSTCNREILGQARTDRAPNRMNRSPQRNLRSPEDPQVNPESSIQRPTTPRLIRSKISQPSSSKSEAESVISATLSHPNREEGHPSRWRRRGLSQRRRRGRDSSPQTVVAGGQPTDGGVLEAASRTDEDGDGQAERKSGTRNSS
ncbi:hypothetical protein Dimus_036104 [Dionaea muscipula]